VIGFCHELIRKILAKGNFVITDDYFVILGMISEDFVNRMNSMNENEIWLNLLQEILADNNKDILVVLKIYGKLNIKEILKGLKEFKKITKGILYFDRKNVWKFISWNNKLKGGI